MINSLTLSAGYFLLTDSFFTTITVVTTLQYEVIEYDTITLSYLTMVGWTAVFIGLYGYWTVQHKYNLRNKTMYCWVVFCIFLMEVWGLVGIWTQKIGFHHPWEFWVFQVWWGLVSPYYSYSQIMVSCPFQTLIFQTRLTHPPSRSIDLRSDTTRQRIPLLFLLQPSRHLHLLRRSHHLEQHHRRLQHEQPFPSLLFLDRRDLGQFPGSLVVCRPGQEPKGTDRLSRG